MNFVRNRAFLRQKYGKVKQICCSAESKQLPTDNSLLHNPIDKDKPMKELFDDHYKISENTDASRNASVVLSLNHKNTSHTIQSETMLKKKENTLKLLDMLGVTTENSNKHFHMPANNKLTLKISVSENVLDTIDRPRNEIKLEDNHSAHTMTCKNKAKVPIKLFDVTNMSSMASIVSDISDNQLPMQMMTMPMFKITSFSENNEIVCSNMSEKQKQLKLTLNASSMPEAGANKITPKNIPIFTNKENTAMTGQILEKIQDEIDLEYSGFVHLEYDNNI